MWMHNGGLGGWKHIKRHLGARLADKWYLEVKGGTDSEWAFALYLDSLERMGYNPSAPPADGFGPSVLRQAMLTTIKLINNFIADIPEHVVHDENVDTRSLLNFAVTDGHSVVCTRYVSSQTDEAASLYYSSGTTWEDKSSKGEYQMDRRDKGADIVLVASEPLTFERESWVTVPTNSTLTIHKQTVMVHPIIDEYYSYNPYHSRSSKFVQDKGLVTNEKAARATAASTPALQTADFGKLMDRRLTPLSLQSPANKAVQIPAERPKKGRTQSSLHESIATTLTPSMHSSTISPALTPTIESSAVHPPLDIRHLSSLQNVRDPARPQEQGNTKKKRRSLGAMENSYVPNQQQEPQIPDSPELRPSAYGDPMKIAQFFPELN